MFSTHRGDSNNNFVILQCGDKVPSIDMTEAKLAEAPEDVPFADMTASINAACKCKACPEVCSHSKFWAEESRVGKLLLNEPTAGFQTQGIVVAHTL